MLLPTTPPAPPVAVSVEPKPVPATDVVPPAVPAATAPGEIVVNGMK